MTRPVWVDATRLRAFPVDAVRALEDATIAVEGNAVLMRRAAAGVAAGVMAELSTLRGRTYGARVLVLVGPGNNGGDALFAGALLARRGAAVTAVRCLGQPHAAGLAELRAAGGALVGLDDVDVDSSPWDIAVDGVLGIGGRPGLPAPVARLADALTQDDVGVVAVDLPSGVSADTGAVPGEAFRAIRTVTFGVRKPCHVIEPARSRCGQLDVVDIGLDSNPERYAQTWLAEADDDFLAARWPFPTEASDKYARGVVGIDTGSPDYPGAGVLSTEGAVHAGAGMVRFLGAEHPAALIRTRLPNVVFSPGRVQAYLFGCGWGERSDGAAILAEAASSGLPTVVDADGLRYLPDPTPSNWLLTPHAGELARLLGQDRSWVTDDPVRASRAGAEQTGAVILLKGATQVVAAPGEAAVGVALAGPSWTAQAGSGDVLAGICATLVAAGREAAEAALLGASVQALAARRHPGALPPQDLARWVSAELGRLENAGMAG